MTTPNDAASWAEHLRASIAEKDWATVEAVASCIEHDEEDADQASVAAREPAPVQAARFLARGVGADLTRIAAERQPDGTWKLVREREAGGETFICDDLHDVIDTVLAAYYPDGVPRPWPRTT